MKKSLKQQSGMFLIEVMISMLIFSLGILGLVGLQTIATRNSVTAEDRTIASTWANNIVSMMIVRKTADPADANLSKDIEQWKSNLTRNSGLPNANSTVVLNNGVTVVTITWKSPSKKAQDNASQYVTQIRL